MTKSIDSSQEFGTRKSEERAAQERLDRVADELAEQASKTEHHYDEDHDIFTK
jgi:hypothetical protein